MAAMSDSAVTYLGSFDFGTLTFVVLGLGELGTNGLSDKVSIFARYTGHINL